MGVSVITRTKDRPLLLPRVVDSLAQQTVRDFEWIIVNDGGRRDCVDETLSLAETAGLQARAIHHDRCRGMEAASNTGIGQARKPYILIHDDDDSLEPRFIEETLGYLRQNPHYIGVVTHSYKVVETLEEDRITRLSRHVLNPRLESVDLPLLAMRNQFPPISFLFTREACEQVGGFDEALPVLGDWDFNLRMLLHGDIGLLPRPLANHHHRYEVEAGDEAYGNTVTAGRHQHLEWESRYRHAKLRQDIRSGKPGLGYLLAQGKQAEMLYRELEHLRVAGDGWSALMKLSQKLGIHKLLRRGPGKS